MNERLLHILDHTACLTRRQMKDYLSGTMLPEEIHAAEAHIASCPLCNMALEGFEAHSEEALEAINALNSGFLKEHFDSITPQIHLNSLSPATVISRPRKKNKTVPLGRLAAVAAIALLAIGVTWYLKYGRDDQKQSGMIAQRDETSAPVPAATPPAQARIADSVLPQPTTASRTNTPALDEPAPIIKESKKEAAPPAAPASAEVAAADTETGNTPRSAEKDNTQPVVTMAYKKPLIEAKKPGKAAEATGQDQALRAEGSLTSNTYAAKRADNASLSGGRTSGTTVVVDGVTEAGDNLRRGDEHFSAGRYSAALKSYRAEMTSGDGSRRSKASLGAARCYINLGQKAKGIELLERVVSEGNGPQRRQARRLLRELRDE